MAKRLINCWKCEKDVESGEVYVAIVWWVGFETPTQRKTLLEDVIYRYCYNCAQTLDLANIRLFELEKPRFQLDGAVTMPAPQVLARCRKCQGDILSGHAYAHLYAALVYYDKDMENDLCEILSWKYCEKCAPELDVENLFILEQDRSVDLLALAKQRELPDGD